MSAPAAPVERSGMVGRVARGAIVNASASAAAALAFGLRNLLAAVFMAPQAVAVWTVCSLLLLTAGALRGAGVTERFVQDREQDQFSAYSEAYSVGLVISVGLGALVAATAPGFARLYDDPRLTWPLVAVGGLIALDGLKFQMAWYYRELRFTRQRTLQLIDALGSVVIAVPLLALGLRWWGLIGAGAAASAITVAVAWVLGPRPRLRLPGRSVIGRYASFSGPVLAALIIGLIAGFLGNLSLRHAAGLAALGWLSLGAITFAATERLSGVMNQSVYPALCGAPSASREGAVELMQRLSWMLAAPVALVVCVLADWGVPSLLGDRWDGAGPIVAALALSAVLRQVAFPYGIVVMATGDTRPLLRYGLLYAAAFAVILIPTTLAFGSDGFAAGTVAVEAVLLCVRWRILHRALPALRLRRHLVQDLAVAALPAVGAAAGLLFTVGSADGARGVAVLVGTLLGTLGLMVLRRELARFTLRLVRR